MELRTARLLLRTLRRNDIDSLFAYYSAPTVARFLLGDVWTRHDAEIQVGKRIERTGFSDDGTQLALVVECEGQVIGDIGLWLTDDTRAKAEIGWVFRPDAAGHGYATEAARAVLDWAFGAGRVRRVAAQMDSRNTASARLCERLGMTREAHLREDWWSKNEWTDTLIYGVLATDRPPHPTS